MPSLESFIAATPECPECQESLWWIHHAELWLCPHNGSLYPAERVCLPDVAPVLDPV